MELLLNFIVDMIDKISFYIEFAARLERKSFFAFTRFLLKTNRLQKRLGAEGGNSCHNYYFI